MNTIEASAYAFEGRSAYFTNYNTGNITGLSVARVAQIYEWRDSSVNTKVINGYNIDGRIDLAMGDYVRDSMSNINFTRTYNEDLSQVRTYAIPYLPTDIYFGVIRPIAAGVACGPTGVPESNERSGFKCAADRWDYVKVYINVAEINKHNSKATGADVYDYHNVRTVIAHELGHALGLRHQLDQKVNSVMTYNKEIISPKLTDHANLGYRYPN